jgi:hypothetical protein
MKQPTPFPPQRSAVERGREAPMVISPWRLVRQLAGIVRCSRAGAQQGREMTEPRAGDAIGLKHVLQL